MNSVTDTGPILINLQYEPMIVTIPLDYQPQAQEQLKLGDTLVIHKHENPSTGYRTEQIMFGDCGLQLMSNVYVPPMRTYTDVL